ncbi:MAG TPA: GNAT family N-acetyltransferase [Polyangia bacterium]|jgi:phosphinothricin acetyltransferase|nr:GNAT family N-acetyltransferase [Polyangia bacterium]
MQIRLAREDDAVQIAAIYRPSVTDGATSFEVQPPDAPEMARRMRSVLAFAAWLVCVDGAPDGSDHVLGFAYASPHNERPSYQWSVNVTVYVHAAHHRRGVGRALYETLFRLLRLQGFYVAHAGITLPNAGSVGLHESFGFRPVGIYPAVGWKLGSWRDVGWWHLPLQERPAAPAPPLSHAQAQALPAWAAVLGETRALPSSRSG